MDPTPIRKVAAWCGGSLVSGDPAALVAHICTDSRRLRRGDFFVAIRGERYDAHEFALEASRQGAMGLMVETVPAGLPVGFPVVQVADTLRAVQALAAGYRRSLRMTVVGLTGSNGKTSTKDFTAGVLGTRFQVTKTEGNLNNHLGLPLSILSARGADDFGIFEMGMNHPGEIAPLAAIAAPDVAIITNIGVAHIEFMGTRDAIAAEKGMLAEALTASGTLIVPAEDEYAESLGRRTRGKVMTAGLDRGEVQARDLQPHFQGTRFTLAHGGESVPAEVPVPGVHMVRNALLAVAAGRVAGLSLAECAAGLTSLQLTKGRLEQKTVRGLHLLDDTYNANPDSVAAALQTLAGLPTEGRRIAVLGTMGELGREAEWGHRRVGAVAAEVGVDCLIGVGADARWITEAAQQDGLEEVLHCPTAEEAVRALREVAHAGDIVLVKGSRSARMERVVEGLQAV